MTYRWQYQAKAEPLFTETVTVDKWFQPISDPVRLSAAVLAFAAIASTTMAIESKIPLPPAAPELLDWVVQHPDPVREPEAVIVADWYMPGIGCQTTLSGGFDRVWHFPPQSGDFIATWTGVTLGPNAQINIFQIGDSSIDDTEPSFPRSEWSISVEFTEVGGPQQIRAQDGSATPFTFDNEFIWTEDVVYNFRLHVNMTEEVFSLYVDDQLVAFQFAFKNTGVSTLEKFGVGADFVDLTETCDFRVVADNSATEIVPIYTQDQPLPFPPERAVDEGGTFEIIAPLDVDITVDNWYVQHPEPIPPAPLNQTAGMFFVAEPGDVEEGDIFVDKWFQPASEPIFLPVRLEHLSPPFVIAPLGATPVAGLVTETVLTMLKTFVGTKGTKFKIQIRQTEGDPTLTTVPDRSVLSVAFHPRTILLASNQTLFPTEDNSLIGVVGFENINRSTLVVNQLQVGTSGGPEQRQHPCFEFNVAAFVGLVYRSAKLVMFREDNPNQVMRPVTVVQCLRENWVPSQMTWNVFRGASPGPDSWTITGARGSGTDHGGPTVIWTPQTGPVDSFAKTPDLTALVEDANQNHGGVLRLMMLYLTLGLAGGRVDYHSLEAVDLDSAFRPHLFFDAF